MKTKKEYKDIIEEVAKTYLEQGEIINVDSGGDYIQEDLNYYNVPKDKRDEMAKEVEDYIEAHCGEYNMLFVRANATMNVHNYIMPIK